MATVWCYKPKNPKANKVIIEGLIITQNPGVMSVGQPHQKLEKWVNKLLRVSILPNAAKTAEEQRKAGLKNSAAEAVKQVEAGPPIADHAKEPDLKLGNLDFIPEEDGNEDAQTPDGSEKVEDTPESDDLPEVSPQTQTAPRFESKVSNKPEEKLATLAQVKTMNFKELRDYAEKVRVFGSRNSKKSYIQALIDAKKIQ